jgi:hypothetical protein
MNILYVGLLVKIVHINRLLIYINYLWFAVYFSTVSVMRLYSAER